jgi:hypothetical protein
MENVKEREFSRTVLLEHLEKNCREIYKPQNLEELNSRISNYMKEKQELKQQIDELESENKLKGKEGLKTKEIKLIETAKDNIQEKIRKSVIEFLQEKNVK